MTPRVGFDLHDRLDAIDEDKIGTGFAAKVGSPHRLFDTFRRDCVGAPGKRNAVGRARGHCAAEAPHRFRGGDLDSCELSARLVET